MKRVLLWLGGIAFFCLLFAYFVLDFRLLPGATYENSAHVQGRVSDVFEGGVKDLCFHLEGDKRVFYINRGLQYEFNLEKAEADFTGKEVTIHYPKRLDGGHIYRLSLEDSVVYNEIKD